MKKPIEKNTNTLRPNVSYPDAGGGSDAGDAALTAVRGRATSHAILENFAPLRMRAAEWIRQLGSEIQAIFTRSQLRSAAKNFISQVHIEAEEKSCDLVPCSQKMLDAEIGKHHGESNIDLFTKIFSKELQSCPDEKILNVIKTLNSHVGANDSLPNLGRYAADFSSAAVEVAAARLAKRLFTDCQKRKASMDKEYPVICAKVHINARKLFAAKMAEKFINLVEVSSHEDVRNLIDMKGGGEGRAPIDMHGKSAGNAEKEDTIKTINDLKDILKGKGDRLAAKQDKRLEVIKEYYGTTNKQNDPEKFNKETESIMREIESLHKEKEKLQTSMNHEQNVLAKMESDEFMSLMLSKMRSAIKNKPVDFRHQFYC